TYAQTQEHLFEVIASIFAVPVGRPGRSSSLRLVRIRPIERNGRGVLMEPGGRDGVDLQRFEGDGAKDLVEIGSKQRIEDVTQPVIMKRGPCEPWLKPGEHAALFQPLPHLIALQRHLSALPKFAPAKWRFYRGQCPGEWVFEVPTTRCVTE